MFTRAAKIAYVVALFAACGYAGVVAIDVQERVEVAGGKPFGTVGAYRRITGTARFAIDPAHPRNQAIADIQLAPLNSKGLVEFSADICILEPVDPRKGNNTIFFEVVNRGRKGLLATFDRARSSNTPLSAEEMGDGLLLKAGYTLVWLGWQHDVPRANSLMRLQAPAATGARGLVRSEYTPDHPVTAIPLGDAGHVPYPVTRGGKATLTVRDRIYGQRTEIPRSAWSLDEAGIVKLAKPATPGLIYEIVYESANPPISGLGLAGIRDLIAYLKRDHQYAIGFGASQSAMVLRGLLYEGFNEDEEGNLVFDGIFAHIAGARRSTFQRFVQASRTAGPLRNASLSTTEQFPFSDLVQVDPVTGARDGLLHAAGQEKQVPKIFYTNSAYEYWGSAASLLHTTPDGKKDAPLPPSTRVYMFSGGQHGPASFPPRRANGQNLPNFNDYRWSLRALLADLRSWIVKNEEPPPSAYPSLARATLTSLENYSFPAVPGVSRPRLIHTPHSFDFGAGYRSRGVIANEPPPVGGSYAVLVPQSDKSGNDMGGVRMPEISCALGSFTGWNLRDASAGNSEYLLSQAGSYIPLPWTGEDRQPGGDPRPAVKESFANKAEYRACVERKVSELIDRRLLLPSDSEPIVQAAIRHWEWREATRKD